MEKAEKERKKRIPAARDRKKNRREGRCVRGGPPIFSLLFLFHPREERIMRADRIAVAAP